MGAGRRSSSHVTSSKSILPWILGLGSVLIFALLLYVVVAVHTLQVEINSIKSDTTQLVSFQSHDEIGVAFNPTLTDFLRRLSEPISNGSSSYDWVGRHRRAIVPLIEAVNGTTCTTALQSITFCQNYFGPERLAALGLTLDQCAAINMYTRQDCYSTWNRMLRAGTSQSWQALTDLLVSALESGPKFTGTVYRGMPVIPGVVDAANFPVGGSWRTAAFMSTSSKESVATAFSGGYWGSGTGIVQQVQIQNGASIDDFSVYPAESEILLLPDSTFDIISTFNTTDSFCTLTLETPRPSSKHRLLKWLIFFCFDEVIHVARDAFWFW